jgi:hypothetical protein
MERLSSAKFTPLTKSQALQIRGGEDSQGRTYDTGVREVYWRDGIRYARNQSRSFTSDYLDGKTWCFRDEEYCWGEEYVY